MTFIFFLVVSTTLFISSKKIKSLNSELTEDRDNKIYLIILSLSLILDFVFSKFQINLNILIYVFIGILESIFLIIVNSKREKEIEKKHSLIKQVVQCLAPVRKGNPLDQDIDSHIEEDLGFKIDFSANGDIDGIRCEMDDPLKWTDDLITRVVFNLNKFIPNRRWVSHPDFPQMECYFEGTKLPPTMAKYPGSFLRPNNYIPLGVGSTGEMGWNLGVKEEEVSDSLFMYEDGKNAQTIITSKAPQALIGGATGGGKAIDLEQEIFILI